MKNQKHILVCDDEEGIRESLRLILEDHYRLSFANDGMQCLDFLKQSPDVDLIFLDIKMPQVNGLDILKQIIKMQPDAKVVIVSGYKSVETASEASKGGASDYITKPFEKKEILALAKKLAC